MTTIKTQDLTGAALNYATGVAEGYEMSRGLGKKVYALIPDFGPIDYEPSTDWRQGGPLIEHLLNKYPDMRVLRPKEGGYVILEDDGPWGGERAAFEGVGNSFLLAISRAVVAAKLGDEVDVPEELA